MLMGRSSESSTPLTKLRYSGMRSSSCPFNPNPPHIRLDVVYNLLILLGIKSRALNSSCP
jgi:hypothetical protein